MSYLDIYLYDIHAHILLIKSKNLEEILNIVREKRILVIENGLNYDYNLKILNIKDRSNNEYFQIALGFHPVDIAKSDNKYINKTLEQIKENIDKAIAIGEVGLDYYWVKDEKLREKERDIFKEILEIAEEHKKPVIIHSRKAEKDVFEIINNYDIISVLHSYTGRLKYVKENLENEKIYYSIPPAVVRIPNFQSLLNILPLDKILLETDSPFMSYEKGKENYPWNVKVTLEYISKIKNLDKEEVRVKLIENFLKVFKI